jgi:hypothetical protein
MVGSLHIVHSKFSLLKLLLAVHEIVFCTLWGAECRARHRAGYA